MKVNSTNIEAIDYDESTELMTVEFKNGRTYEYRGVERGVFEALANENADTNGSVGKTFNRLVRSAYEAVEVTR